MSHLLFCLCVILLLSISLNYSWAFSNYDDGFNIDQYTQNDPCPKPLPNVKYEHAWTCGTWQEDHGEIRRIFNLYLSENSTLDIGHDQTFKGWTFNKTIPAPTMRMTEGDLVTIYVHNPTNSKFPHSLHMHSIHPSVFDGAGIDKPTHFINPGQKGQYIFTAMPAGLYPFHCHIDPVDKHISKGLYGMMIIDPKEGRAPANEIMLMMSAYDTNEDKVNDFYVYNGKIHQYVDKPIPIERGELNRIYLVNMGEYRDTLSFHLHGLMFNYWSGGTTNSSLIFNDIVTLSQGDRGILEFVANNMNSFMFHPHNNDAADKGQMGFIDVK